MGDPKKIRKKYRTPQHPWEATRLAEESILIKGYGLKNKKEIWKVSSLMRKYTHNAKNLITSRTKQAEVEKLQLLTKLLKLGLLQEGAKIEDVLGLDIKDFMERRLQSVVFKKGLARSMKQARQFITHEHILVNGKKISVPSYLVLRDEEPTVAFIDSSSLSNPDHAERNLPEKVEEVKPESDKKEKSKPKKTKESKKSKENKDTKNTEDTETKEVKESEEETKKEVKEEVKTESVDVKEDKSKEESEVPEATKEEVGDKK